MLELTKSTNHKVLHRKSTALSKTVLFCTIGSSDCLLCYKLQIMKQSILLELNDFPNSSAFNTLCYHSWQSKMLSLQAPINVKQFVCLKVLRCWILYLLYSSRITLNSCFKGKQFCKIDTYRNNTFHAVILQTFWITVQVL